MSNDPKLIGREFVRRYNLILNKSPESLHCFFNDDAKFDHDNIDSSERTTISIIGKDAIRNAMLEQMKNYKHKCTIIHFVDTLETLNDFNGNDGLMIQVSGEISYNGDALRPFSQSFVLVAKSPFQYFVVNDIFRFTDTTFDSIYETDSINQQKNENKLQEETIASDIDVHSDKEGMDLNIQSMNLKNILQESRVITKEAILNRVPTPPKSTEDKSNANAVAPDTNELDNEKQLFQDKCILTIGNRINPNIQFDDNNTDDMTQQTTKSTEQLNFIGSNDDNHNHNKKPSSNRKRRDKRKNRSTPNDVESSYTEDSTPEKNTTQPSLNTSAKSLDESIGKSSCEEKNSTTTSTTTSEMRSETSSSKQKESSNVSPEAKSYADLVIKNKSKFGSMDSLNESPRWNSIFNKKQWKQQKKTERLHPRRSERLSLPTKDRYMNRSLEREQERDRDRERFMDKPQRNPPSFKDDVLQVFIGNIPHSASEADIRAMFSRFGGIIRFRVHSNPTKTWLRRYAFLSYENIECVRKCLKKRNDFYWPDDDSVNGEKLNVNGHESVVIDDEEPIKEKKNARKSGNKMPKNFSNDSKNPMNKRHSLTSNGGLSDVVSSMKRERNTDRKESTRA